MAQEAADTPEDDEASLALLFVGSGGVMTGWGFGGLVYVTHDHERAGSTAETARNCEAAIPLRLSGVNFGFGFQG